MLTLGYITVIVLMLSGGWFIWSHRRAQAAARARNATHHRIDIGEPLGVSNLRGYLGMGLLIHGLMIGLSILPLRGCLHERPTGVFAGEGQTIAQGQIATNLQQVLQQQKLQKQQQEQRRQITRESLLQILRKNREVQEDDRKALARMMDPVGLPDAIGHGSTAAGSPFGTRLGGELWLYRVKHSGENWDANPKALPALLQEVKKASPNLKVASRQEVITLDELPRHKGKFFPTLLFFTGTGSVNATDQEKRHLREYLLAGGFVVADSSGGNFEENFKQFMRQVYGKGRIRSIEFDHDVFRGNLVLYQLSHGCPIYRAHGRQDDAEGVFDANGRLLAFISPGDLGSAWASVAMGKSRTSVERAFQMGTNLVSWSMATVRDTREEKESGKDR